MMQSFSKTELDWIYTALKHEAEKSCKVMQETEEYSPLYHLAELSRDNLHSTMDKILKVINGNCKRITIK